ncbi:MAG: hypothetical protein ACUZ8I_17280 [Candidatus Scalindua sp.]
MKAPVINYENQEVSYKGYFIQLWKLKELTKELWPELVKEYSFAKRFNSKTGKITAIISWGTIFHIINEKINEGNGIRKLLDIILIKENLI